MFAAPSLTISVCPQIQAEGDKLTASTSGFIRILNLGSFSRRVVVDRVARTVTVAQRSAWLLQRERVLSFAEIAAVTYGYDDANPFSVFSTTHDSVDRYVVGLLLVGGEEVRLFSFVGDGSFTNEGPLPDWWYWEEYVLDRTGSQERESRLFVQLLSKMIGVTIAPSSQTRE
ncbi:MAG: hypothetical protein JNN07_03140 [Verrucomicrobiales bacterium]|nr:hypothetical protein [Verrucomicrobiales bacterium]